MEKDLTMSIFEEIQSRKALEAERSRNQVLKNEAERRRLAEENKRLERDLGIPRTMDTIKKWRTKR